MLRHLRNIGIIAHINAGKTTTTERILYLAGSTETVGDVDRGNTITDYLIQERDRGITITSAAVTFNWKKHQINLIDTPGHVDFTVEVERSLAVLDGAVTILDASAGVQAQTVTVWNQAAKYNLPNVILLNKYDKPQANYSMCLRELTSNLDAKAHLIQLPVKTPKSTQLSSILDVVDRKYLQWKNPEKSKGAEFLSVDLQDCHSLDKKLIDDVEEEREKLVNTLTDLEDNFAAHVLQCNKIGDVSSAAIKDALRKTTLDGQVCPVLVGSSFKYIGVQQLLDAIVHYLPSPDERLDKIHEMLAISKVGGSNEGIDNCALIFKIAHDRRLGPLAYLRVYKGQITKQMKLKNLETGSQEEVKKIYRLFGDQLIEISEPVISGDIVAVSGILRACTGDILVDLRTIDQSSDRAIDGAGRGDLFRVLKAKRENIIVPQINRMEPVYYCSIESRLGSQQLKLEQSLACVAREDPSFTYELDDQGITTIRGMGKLHLEVARDRLQSEHGIDAILGPMQISYRETIEGSATEELSVDRLIGSSKSTISSKIYVRSKPGSGAWSDKMLRLDLNSESGLGKLRNDHRKAIGNGVESALKHGPARGYPLIDCDVLILDFKANSRCSLALISSVVSRCLTSAIRRCSPVLLEPIMLLEVVAPNECNGLILGDLASRRGILEGTTARPNGSIVVRAKVPLASLADYSEFLRINTSGRASFSIELHNYSALSEQEWSKFGL